jgi:RNA polymerase sigma factor (sigma-70 family)
MECEPGKGPLGGVGSARQRSQAAGTAEGPSGRPARPGAGCRPSSGQAQSARERASAGARPADDLVERLFRAHSLTLVRTALLLVGDRGSAEDVVQEAFLGLYRSVHRLRDQDSALAYLRASVLNGCRSVMRSRRRTWLRRVTHDPPVWSAESAVLSREDRRAVMAATALLPRRQREVLALRYHVGLTDHEIAQVLGVSRSTVSSCASRALARLERDLQEEP